MGIIQKQAIKGTVYTYIGAFLGLINVVILFPRILSTDEIGLINILLAYAMVLSQFGSLGFNSATTRMFTYFKTDDNKHNGFLFLNLIVSLVGFLLVLGVFMLLKPILLSNNDNADSSQLLFKYFFYIVPLLFFTLFFNAFDHYNKVLFNAVRGTFLREFVPKVLILIVIILYVFDFLNFSQFVFSYVCAFCSPSVIIMILLIKDKQFNLRPNFKFLTKDMKKTLLSVSLFGIITSAIGIVILNIDRIMIERMLGLSSAGIYATSFFFGTFIILPARSLNKISSAVISDSWKNNDIENINKIYYKSTLTQLIIGSFLLIGIWGNIDNIIILMTEKFEAGRYVILFVSLAFFTDMASGVSSAILTNSKKYRIQAVFLIIMILLLISANFILIQKYHIVGAAIALFISKFIFNLIKYFYLWYRFKLQPFDYRSLLVIIIAISVYGITYLIPEFELFYIDIIVRSSAITLLFGVLIFSFKISEDINNGFIEYLHKLMSIFNKK